MRLVLGVDVAPERVLRLVEDHGEMGRLETSSPVANELKHFGGEQPNRPGRQAVRAVIVLLILPDRLIIGAEDKRRAVDEKNMVAGADRAMGLGHGHHIIDAASERHLGPLGRRCSLALFIEQSLFELQFRFPGCAESPLHGGSREKGRAWLFRNGLAAAAATAIAVGVGFELRSAQSFTIPERVRRGFRLRLCLHERPRARPDGGRFHRPRRLSARA